MENTNILHTISAASRGANVPESYTRDLIKRGAIRPYRTSSGGMLLTDEHVEEIKRHRANSRSRAA